MRCYLLLSSLLLVNYNTAAADLDAMQAAIDAGRAAEIVSGLAAAADGGDAAAQTLLAGLYQRGEGVDKDFSRALRLYLAAAERGNAEAQFNLGNMYLLGEGVKADEVWAMTYYRQAAVQGHALATRNLTQLYRASGMEPPPLSLDNERASGSSNVGANAEVPEVTVTVAVADESMAPTTRLGVMSADKDVSAAAPTVQADVAGAAQAQGSGTPAPAQQELANAPALTDKPSVDEREAIHLAEEHGVAIDWSEGDAPSDPLPAVDEMSAAQSGSDALDAEQAATEVEVAARADPAAVVGRGTTALLVPVAAPSGAAADIVGLHAAANAGDAAAMFELANRYREGTGLLPDEAMTITLYREAARRGHAEADVRLREFFAEAGIEMPDLSRPAAPVLATAASRQGRADPAAAPGAATAAESAREPYAYPVIEHPEAVAERASLDQIESAKPRNHQVISGGKLVSSAGSPVLEVEIPVSDERAGALNTPQSVMSTAPAVLTTEEMMVEVDDAIAAVPAAPLESLPPAVAEPVVTVGEAASAEPAGAAALTAAGTGASAEAAHTAVVAPVASEKTTVFGRIKQAFVDSANRPVDSRAPGAAAAQAAKNAAQQAVAADPKLVLAQQAEPDPILYKPTMQEAKSALAEGDFESAAAMFATLANDGDAEAQAHLGYMTYQGEGVERDLPAAVEWYRRAASQGNRDAQYNLAVAYAFGEGVARDEAEAAVWYRRAGEQGSAIAQYSLGVSYALGEGVEKSDTEALRWYRMAAEQGYTAAQYNLGYMYRVGQGVAQSDAEALRWFALAAQGGHPGAQYSLGYMYRVGRGAEQDLEQAVRWYRLAADQGHAQARADLAALQPAQAP